MSGGHFDYDQYRISRIADDIEIYTESNKYNFNEDVLRHFRDAVLSLRKSQVYAQRIDWLLSGDDGEESFLKRLDEELQKL